MNQYSPSTFFNAYFLTEPYLAFLEMMVVGLQSDGYSWIYQARNWFDQLATLTDHYPDIEIACMIGWDAVSDPAGWAAFRSFVNMAKNHPSITIIGMEHEYWHGLSGDWSNAQAIVLAAGKKFISYYHPPAPYQEIYHTNFPGANAPGDFEQVLDWADVSTNVGMSNGYYYAYTFPDNRPLPLDPTTRVYSHGWSQEVVDKAISHAISNPYINRQYISLCAGFSTTSFTGVSGLTTTCLWDNPVLRGWIWSNPNYATNFKQGAGTLTHILTIDTTPINGAVYVDSVNMGMSPVVLTLPIGTTHTIRFGSIVGYATPPQQTVVMDSDKVVTGIYVLIPKTYTLNIVSTPLSGSVTVDGVSRGSTPVQVGLSPGSHTIVLGP